MATHQQDLAVLELWELLNRCMGKPELASRVLVRFQKQLDEDLNRIEMLLDKSEFESAREVTHRLKGAAANVAAHALRESAHSLETALQMGFEEQFELIFRGLKEERNRFEEAARLVNLAG